VTNAVAEADGEWTFSPLQDGVADIGIVGDNNFIEAWQSASLFDLTSNEQVWYFYSNTYDLGISETMPTLLDADHVYVMHLNAFAAGRGDGTWSNLRVSGIRAVPDNVDSFVCLCMGLFGGRARHMATADLIVRIRHLVTSLRERGAVVVRRNQTSLEGWLAQTKPQRVTGDGP
jgi:hypothetical protein